MTIDARAFAHWTAENVATWTEEDSDYYTGLICDAFAFDGDPRGWEHFAEVSEEMQANLCRNFARWTDARLLQEAIEEADESPARPLIN